MDTMVMETTGTEVLLKMTTLLTLVLAFSLVIERALEILKTAFDVFDSHFNLHIMWTKKTKKLQKIFNNRLKNLTFLNPSTVAGIIYKLDVMLVSNQNNSNHTVPVLSGNLVRSAYIKIISKFTGIGLGIITALIFHLNFLTTLDQSFFTVLGVNPLATTPPWVPTILSGILIGLGAAPMHKIIQSLEKHRESRMNAQGGAQ